MFRTINVKELVEKEVVGFGNGSIVYTPKKWIGKKVLVVLEEKPIDVKGEVMEALKQHLPSIEGIFLYGSFARNEQNDESDIDLLVIADKRIKPRKNEKMDFSVATKKEFVKMMKTDPTLFTWQIMKESKPIMNEALLSELRNTAAKPDLESLLIDTIGAFKKTKEILDANREKKYLPSNAAIYSLILRLKSLFLAQCYMKGRAFSNKSFKAFIKRCGFNDAATENFLGAYRTEKDDRKTGIKILLHDAEKLFEAAKIEFLKTEEMMKWEKTNTRKA